jgi:integrase/recombinase XerD
MLGLRVSEACAGHITDLHYQAGYELLHALGKGAKPADIPLPLPVLRAVREVVDGRTAGITRPISGHGLRRPFCTTGLVAGISIRDMQHAVRHADPRTTMRYDMA